ncbi:MAG: hypothetical protein IJF71_05710 [Clostridia bacterium]|nr:hypothetical protein [Clostridia bacterium]
MAEKTVTASRRIKTKSPSRHKSDVAVFGGKAVFFATVALRSSKNTKGEQV